MKNEPEEWLILGVTQDGRPFRPRDWAERVCGVLAYFNNGRWVYSKHAHPVMRKGQNQPGVLVETVLKEIDPNTYEFIMGFARKNQLKVVVGREIVRQGEPAIEIEAKFPAEIGANFKVGAAKSQMQDQTTMLTSS